MRSHLLALFADIFMKRFDLCRDLLRSSNNQHKFYKEITIK